MVAMDQYINNFNTYDFIMNFNAFFRSLATNQFIRKPDIRGAVLYNLKNAWKLPNHHVERTFNACFIHSSFLSSVERVARIVVKSETKNVTYCVQWKKLMKLELMK
jgi:hypothetical protein